MLFLFDFPLQVDDGHCINLQTTYLFFICSTPYMYIFKVTLYIELKCMQLASLCLQLSTNTFSRLAFVVEISQFENQLVQKLTMLLCNAR